MTDVIEAEHLHTQVAALVADRDHLVNTLCFLIDLTSASVAAVIQCADVVAEDRPDLAAQATQIADTWTKFLGGAQLARAAAELQNAPSSDAPQ